MAQNIYTQDQVEDALLRGIVALLLISQKIQSQFLYFYSDGQYQTYKDLQYDIYCLYTTINNEQGFVEYNLSPTVYELDFYNLVGALIKKTKTVDVGGAYGGAINPNYQSPVITIIVEEGGFNPTPPYNKTQANLIEDGAGSGNWYLPFLDDSGNLPPAGLVPVLVTTTAFDGSFTFTYNNSFSPGRIYGFTSNAAQVITVYLNL